MVRRRAGYVAIGIGAALLGGFALAAVFAFTPCCGSGEPKFEGPAPKTAVIVDQLESTSPDPEFVAEATLTLEEAGYVVDYVPGHEVTVEYYRQLAAKGYGLVIVRAHSGFVRLDSDDDGPQQPFMFTSEPYDENKHKGDQDDRRLSVAYYLDTDIRQVEGDPNELLEEFKNKPRYFGIKPSFVRDSMDGSFPGSTIVLMGCSGLATDELAEAFVDKGARAVVGWDDLVSAAHTDTATAALLQRMFVDQQATADAVAATATEVGADPTYGGELKYYE